MADTTVSIESTATRTDDLDGRFLTFYIGDVLYGIELANVIEIISVPLVTRVPGLPEYIKGIINLRGKVVSIIDVRLKFNQEERAYDGKTCIIVVTIHDMTVGLVVDSVAGVLSVDPNQSTPPPDLGVSCSDKYLKSIARVDGKIVMNIDCEKFFQSDLAIY
ncbi:MAG: purine-binding chemotaxis protein CheW [Anaerotruncus sp.]|nr:purine-binding chemotaxis protein CheW [Anaerotruncus sp.]